MIYLHRSLFILTVLAVFQFPPSPSSQSSDSGFEETLRIGRGAVQHAEWQPNGSLILIDTLRGAWLYSVNERRLNDVGHFEGGRLARFSPDGQFLAGVNERQEITRWETTNFEFVTVSSGHQAAIQELKWNPNGHQLATLDHEGVIFVRDTDELEISIELHLPGTDHMAWNPGGNYLAGLDSDTGELNVWNTAGELIFESTLLGFDFVWRNHTQLLRRMSDETPRGEIWDVQSGEQITSLRIGYRNAYSPDGSKLAQAYDYRLNVIDAETSESLLSMTSPLTSVMTWSPDNQKVAIGAWKGNSDAKVPVLIVDTNTGETQRLINYEASIQDIVWNSNNEDFLIIDEASRIYVSEFGAPATIAHTDIGAIAAWRSDGEIIAAADTNYGSRLWDAQTGDVWVARMHQGDPTSKLAWQPGGTLLATAIGTEWESSSDNVIVWDSNFVGDAIYDHTVILPHTSLVAGIAWSPDGTTLASAEQRRYIRLWKPAEPDIIRVIDTWAIRLAPYIDYTQTVYTLQWSTSGDILSYSYFSSGNGGGMGLVDVAKREMLAENTPASYETTWMWTPDNQLIWAKWGQYGDPGPTASSAILSLHRESVTDQESVSVDFPPMNAPIDKAIFSPDAQLLIAFDDLHNGILWDVHTRTSVIQFTNVVDAVWSPDSTMLAVYKTDGIIRVIDVQTGNEVHQFDQYLSLVDKPQVIWSPDSQRIALLASGVLFVYDKLSEVQ